MNTKDCRDELREVFNALTPDNQERLLEGTRLARSVEKAAGRQKSGCENRLPVSGRIQGQNYREQKED